MAMYEVIQVVGIVLITMGLIEMVRLLTLFFVKPKEKQGWILAIPVKGHRENLEYQIRSAASHIKKADHGVVSVVVVECGMDLETQEISSRTCERFKGTQTVKLEGLNQWVKDFATFYRFTN